MLPPIGKLAIGGLELQARSIIGNRGLAGAVVRIVVVVTCYRIDCSWWRWMRYASLLLLLLRSLPTVQANVTAVTTTVHCNQVL